MNTLIRFGLLTIGVALATSWTAQAQAVKPSNLDDAMTMSARKIADGVRKKTKNNAAVGVLNFQVQLDNKEPSLRVGAINASLAERVEVALLRGQLEDDEEQVRVIRNASKTANDAHKGISYLTGEGRKALFGLKYSLWVESDSVAADLFVTGTAVIDFEKEVVTVKLVTFSAESEKFEPLMVNDKGVVKELVIEAPLDRMLLGESGQSYTFSKKDLERVRKRGAFDDHVPDNIATSEVKKEIKEGPKVDPEKEPLVELRLFVKSGTEEIPIKLKPDDKTSGFTFSDLKVGDRVYIRLIPKIKDRLAILVKVNGVSTLYDDKRDPRFASKWVTSDGKELVIDGFYTADTGKNLEPFVIIPDSEAIKQPMSDPYMITMHVFIEGGYKEATASNASQGMRGLTDRKVKEYKETPIKEDPKKDPVKPSLKTTADIKKMLVALNSKDGFRSVIGKGTVEEGSELKTVTFTDPQEVQLWTIRYK